MTMITLTTGTAFIMWLGEQISERGIGNGISLIIFAGIVAGMPGAAGTVANFVRHDEWSIFRAVAMALLMVAVVAATIYMKRPERRSQVAYAIRKVARPMHTGQTSHLP